MGEQRAGGRRQRRTEGRNPGQRQQQDGVERDDAQRRGADPAVRVERRRQHRDRTGEDHIGRGDVQIVGGQRAALAAEARRQRANHRRREQQADQRQRPAGQDHRFEHRPEEPVGAVLAVGGLDPQPQGHEGRVERALGQHAAEDVDELQDREERIGEDAGAEHRSDAHVAKEAEQAREQRRAAHRGDVARQRHAGSASVFILGAALQLRPLDRWL